MKSRSEEACGGGDVDVGDEQAFLAVDDGLLGQRDRLLGGRREADVGERDPKRVHLRGRGQEAIRWWSDGANVVKPLDEIKKPRRRQKDAKARSPDPRFIFQEAPKVNARSTAAARPAASSGDTS